MDYRILGPLEAFDGERALSLGGTRQRSVLALLLLRSNEALTRDTLIDELWGESPAANRGERCCRTASRPSEKSSRTAARRLRTVGGGLRARRSPPASSTGSASSKASPTAARRSAAGENEEAAEQLRSALSLWRGGQPLRLRVRPLRPGRDRPSRRAAHRGTRGPDRRRPRLRSRGRARRGARGARREASPPRAACGGS
jgi:hypothetical protein